MAVSKNLKLMVADDHRMFIEGMKLVLEDELRLDVIDVAFNGREAIDKCLQNDYDIVMMDINMPVIGGIEATEEIKRLRPSVKILMVSMNSDHSSLTRAIKAGADGYLLKSDNADEIARAIKNILRGELYLSETLSGVFKKDGTGRITTRDELIHFSDNLITSRERGVLKLIAEGYTNQQIADTLHISVRTVDTHRTNMLVKLKLPNTAALIKFSIENKLL